MNPEALEAARDAIRGGRTFLIACHVRPDGDTLGSGMALWLALGKLKKQAWIVSVDGVPDPWGFIPHSDVLLTSAPDENFDVAIAVDADGIERLGNAKAAVESAQTVISIDHHAGAAPFGDIRIHNASRAATAEIVLGLLDALEIPLDAEMATCLMAGIIGDTGAFRFTNVTPQTFETSSRLMMAGADPAEIARRVYENRGLTATKVLGHVLADLRTAAEGRVVWGSVSLQSFGALGANDTHTDGVVNFIRAVRGAKVGLLFRECPDATVRVSLRSNGDVNVSKIAGVFGGGGHSAAAGCTVEGTLAEAEDRVIGEVVKWMAS